MKLIGWKVALMSALAVGIPCFVLGENSEPPKAPPAGQDAQQSADHEPGQPASPEHGTREQMHKGHEPKMEKVAFLGIGTRPVSEEVRAQLKLPDGTALLVDRVEDDSPAAKAGLKKFDVLTKVDDQLIINPQQLAVLIRMHKANDQVKLSVIHEAASATVPVTLIEKEMPAMEHGGMPGPGGREDEHGGPMGRMGGGMHGMRRGMGHGMGMWMGMHRGMEGREGMRGEMGMRRGWGGPEGMRGEMGMRRGLEDGDGMRGGMGMRRGPGGPEGTDSEMRPRPGMEGGDGMRGPMGMRRGMEGPDGMRGHMGGFGGMPGPWGMRRGPGGSEDEDGPPARGPHGRGGPGAPTTQPTPNGPKQ